jgi:hypothetical protein
MAAPFAVDDPLVGLFLRLDTHDGAAALFTIFIFALWNLLQYNYALFAGLFFQPALQHDQPADDLPPTSNKRPRARLKFKYVSDRDDNIFEILAIASRTTWSLYWFKLVPAYLVIACEMHARWIAPKMESSTDDFSPRIYPLFVVILSMLPLSGVMVSIFHIGAGTNIQFSKKSTFTELQVYFGLHPEGRSGLQSRSYPLEGTGFINCVQRCDTQ